jgi:predicted RNA-binding Zn ribbon-like protein
MDLVRYAERSADLVNAHVEDTSALVRFLSGREWLQGRVTDRDVAALRAFQVELRRVFEASAEQDEALVVRRVNDLLSTHPVTPYIAGDGPGTWHLHVADRSSSVAELVVAESLMGLATLVCDLGGARLGVCDAAPCTDVFVDTSPNQSRRYCSDRCSSRANVAAYRARRRAATAVGTA